MEDAGEEKDSLREVERSDDDGESPEDKISQDKISQDKVSQDNVSQEFKFESTKESRLLRSFLVNWDKTFSTSKLEKDPKNPESEAEQVKMKPKVYNFKSKRFTKSDSE